MNSTKLIEIAKKKYENLKDKNLDLESFYTGFLIGYGVSLNG